MSKTTKDDYDYTYRKERKPRTKRRRIEDQYIRETPLPSKAQLALLMDEVTDKETEYAS